MDHNFSGFLSLNITSNVLATSTPVLVFIGTIQPYFEKTSITTKIYFTPLLCLRSHRAEAISDDFVWHLSDVWRLSDVCRLHRA